MSDKGEQCVETNASDDQEISDSQSIKTQRRADQMDRNGGTYRSYPQRLAEAKTYNSKYNVTVFKTQKDYDVSRRNSANNKYEPVEHVDFDDTDIHRLWEYANRIFDTKLDPERYKFDDLTYQEFADLTRCRVIVNKNFSFSHYECTCPHNVSTGYSYGGGLPGYEYKQNSHGRFANNAKGHSIDNPNNISAFNPVLPEDSEKRLNVIVINPPVSPDDYQLKVQMKKNSNPLDAICMGCFAHDGRMWMLKGTGTKSLGKTKGMKREKQRDLNEKIAY